MKKFAKVKLSQILKLIQIFGLYLDLWQDTVRCYLIDTFTF